MNIKLILQLSIFGLGMAIATVYVIPSGIEPFIWFAIFIVCAYFIAARCSEKYFLHGFLVSMLNSIWITLGHIILFEPYIANHGDEATMMAQMPMPDSPRLIMALTGPVVGIISGLILGLFAFVASKLVRNK